MTAALYIAGAIAALGVLVIGAAVAAKWQALRREARDTEAEFNRLLEGK